MGLAAGIMYGLSHVPGFEWMAGYAYNLGIASIFYLAIGEVFVGGIGGNFMPGIMEMHPYFGSICGIDGLNNMDTRTGGII